MATAILDLELERLPDRLDGLGSYPRALALLRFRGRPVGQAIFPVVDGRVDSVEFRQGIARSVGRPLWEKWLDDFLREEERLQDGEPPQPPLSTTVAVCTRERPDDLRRCLGALLRLPNDGQEIIVVDNRPATDATRRVVSEFDVVRYVREDRPGLGAARNRALREARGDIVAFTDDDAVPDAGWLRSLAGGFDDPLVACVTGLTMPLELETEAQEWSERIAPFGRGFERRVFTSESCHPLHAAQAGAGVNMAVRKQIVQALGGFDEALGPGTPARSGDDHEMFYRVLARGYGIVYEPGALCWHRHRRTWDELRRMLHGYGAGVYAYLTRSLFVERELGAFRLAAAWFRHDQLPALVRSLLRRPEARPLDLIRAELTGCLAGPWSYFKSRRLIGGRQP